MESKIFRVCNAEFCGAAKFVWYTQITPPDQTASYKAWLTLKKGTKKKAICRNICELYHLFIDNTGALCFYFMKK